MRPVIHAARVPWQDSCKQATGFLHMPVNNEAHIPRTASYASHILACITCTAYSKHAAYILCPFFLKRVSYAPSHTKCVLCPSFKGLISQAHFLLQTCPVYPMPSFMKCLSHAKPLTNIPCVSHVLPTRSVYPMHRFLHPLDSSCPRSWHASLAPSSCEDDSTTVNMTQICISLTVNICIRRQGKTRTLPILLQLGGRTAVGTINVVWTTSMLLV